MKTIAISSQKGGVGKSTITIHLAVVAEMDGISTLIADLDPHSQTSKEWALERELETPVVVSADIKDVSELIKQAKKEGFGLVLLDCPPYINDAVLETTKVADFTLIPCPPRFPDLRTLPRVVESVSGNYSVVLSQCPPPRFFGMDSGKAKEARELLVENHINVSPKSVSRRESFADSLISGEAVNEFDPESKAANEIIHLFKWLKSEVLI